MGESGFPKSPQSHNENSSNLSHSDNSASDSQPSGVSLNLFPATHPFRLRVMWVIRSPFFDYFIILTILATAVQLAMDTPLLDPFSRTATGLFWVDIATTVVFVCEAILKIVAWGLIANGPKSYIRNKWN